MLLLFVLTCNAQQVSIVEKKIDGYIITVDGIEYRAFNAAKMRELEVTKKERDSFAADITEANKAITTLTHENELLKKDVAFVNLKNTSLQTDLDTAHEDAKRNFSLFMTERDLRVEAQQFIPRGNASGTWGKVLDFLNSQPAQVGFKLVIPTAQAFKVFTSRCP